MCTNKGLEKLDDCYIYIVPLSRALDILNILNMTLDKNVFLNNEKYENFIVPTRRIPSQNIDKKNQISIEPTNIEIDSSIINIKITEATIVSLSIDSNNEEKR